MKKLLITSLFILFIIPTDLLGQTGLDFKIDYDKMIEDSRRNNEAKNEAYITRYKKTQEAYKNALELNSFSATPKPNPSSGWYTALMTNGYDQMGNRSVFVENGVVTKYQNGKGEIVAISKGGKIIDFRTVILINNELRLELFFNISIKE